jgi:hypothetical protein
MAAETLLALWNDTPTRRAIVDFIQTVSSEGSPGFVAPAERVAVFDNDGTLWSEKPVPIQLDFTLFRMAELAGQDPSLAERQPYRAAVERDFRWLDQAIVKHYHGDDADLGLLMGAVESAFEGMEVEAFGAEVMEWLTTERVISSALGLDFDDRGDDTRLVYKSKVEFFDDGPTKPVRIWSRVGYRPLVTGGNSNGDIPMMRFARTGGREALRLLVLHDDADREFAYTTGAEDALDRAKTHGWTVVSMKEDWSAVFASA